MASLTDSSKSEDGWTNLKSHILDRISDVESAGSFATFGSFENLVLPGIFVKEVGAIPLPLSSRDAQSLIRVSRQAPFGKGNQTLVDENVRKTWEIDGSKVSFTNKAWHSWLEGVVRTAAKDLGVVVPINVRAELHKMLLYERGAMFKPHKDTEKTPGMFGTLVICLPSEHFGGAVRLTHGQEEKTFDTAELSAFKMTYIAWYADVVHEVQPVQSGLRWTFTYNLVNASPVFPQSAAGLNAQTARFCQTLAEWRGLDNGPECLCYALDHQYTVAGLKLANLKGKDYYRARYVAESCNKAGDFCVLLASLQKIVTFPNDEGREEDTQCEIQLDRIVDLEGFTLRKSLPILEDYIVQQQLYESRNPDDQSGGEYMGNQHADIDQVYNDTVMLIISTASATSFLLGYGYELDVLKDFLQCLQKCYKMRNNDRHIRELIVQTCQNHLTRAYSDDVTKDLFLGPIAVAAIFIADQGLFSSTIRSFTNGFNENTSRALGELICFKTPVVPEDHLIEAFSRIPKLYEIRRCLQAFRSGCLHSDAHQAEYLANWVRNRMSKAIKSVRKAYPQDAAELIHTANEYDEEFIKPFIARFVKDSNFLNALAVEILSYSHDSESLGHDNDLAARLLPLVLDAAVSQFELQKYSSASKNSSSRCYYPYSSWPNCFQEEEKGRRDARNIVALYQELLRSDRKKVLRANGKKASQLLSKIQVQTESLPHSELERLCVPLLEQMMHVSCLPDLCQFYQSMMVTYITKIVGKEPEKPMDWSRPNERKNCYLSCPDCQLLQEFLMEPSEESRRFILPKDSWHLMHSVPSECETSTDESQEPPVLIVTKSLKGWAEKHIKWQERASKVQETFQRLPQTELKLRLAKYYDAIMDLRMVKLQNEVSSAAVSHGSITSTRRVGRRTRAGPKTGKPGPKPTPAKVISIEPKLNSVPNSLRRQREVGVGDEDLSPRKLRKRV